MKRTVWSLVCLICMAAWCGTLRAETLKGNGKVITKEYQFADFDEINFVGPAEFTYVQSEAAPSVMRSTSTRRSGWMPSDCAR